MVRTRLSSRLFEARNSCRNLPTFWSGNRPRPQAGRPKAHLSSFPRASKAWHFCRNLNLPRWLMNIPLRLRQSWNEARERPGAGEKGRSWASRKRRAHACYGAPLRIFLHGLLPLAKQGCGILTSRAIAGQEKSQTSGGTQALAYLLS